jgi:membrane protein implicated in regulation of membrane protease activity
MIIADTQHLYLEPIECSRELILGEKLCELINMEEIHLLHEEGLGIIDAIEEKITNWTMNANATAREQMQESRTNFGRFIAVLLAGMVLLGGLIVLVFKLATYFIPMIISAIEKLVTSIMWFVGILTAAITGIAVLVKWRNDAKVKDDIESIKEEMAKINENMKSSRQIKLKSKLSTLTNSIDNL